MLHPFYPPAKACSLDGKVLEPRVDFEDMEKNKVLTQPRIEPRFIGRLDLYRLSHLDCCAQTVPVILVSNKFCVCTGWTKSRYTVYS